MLPFPNDYCDAADCDDHTRPTETENRKLKKVMLIIPDNAGLASTLDSGAIRPLAKHITLPAKYYTLHSINLSM